AIERRLEVNQHETDFFHLPAEMTARQPMRKFVNRDDGEYDDPQEEQSMKIEQTLNAASELVPMQITDDKSARDGQCGEYMECLCKRPIRARQQPLENFFRVDRQELPVEKISIFDFVAVDRGKFVPNLSCVKQPLIFK